MKQKWRKIWLTALALGWLFDIIFWNRNETANIALYTWIMLAATIGLLGALDVLPDKRVWPLIALSALLGLVSAVRLEPMTVTLSILSGILLYAIAMLSFTSGGWCKWSFLDYLKKLVALSIGLLGNPITIASRAKKEEPSASRKLFWPIFRGFLLALPIVLFFALVLSEADPVFKHQVKQFLALFRLENWPEYLFRLFYILMLAYFFAGFWIQAAFKNKKEQEQEASDSEKTFIKPFLGTIESIIVLGSVVALFAAFVLVQFRYFFGGLQNITIEGYTYAQYARRGFGELVFVSIISLAFLLGLKIISRLESEISRKIFLWLASGMLAEVMIILISAFRRLGLYEQVYGYTRLRLYTHIFMIWLGILLLIFAALLWRENTRQLPFFILISALGFIFSLALINVDGFIARQNVARAIFSAQLDGKYLANNLTLDAVPALADAYYSADLPSAQREQIGGALFCITAHSEMNGWHLARWRARRWMKDIDLSAYAEDNYQIILPSGDTLSCYRY